MNSAQTTIKTGLMLLKTALNLFVMLP